MHSNHFLMTLAVACALAAAPTAVAAPVADPINRPATSVRMPGKAFLTGMALAGKRVVAVGERGIIALSDDNGSTWRQAKVPTSVTLTAVQFPTPTQGWAVGHFGIVLHSTNGGESWTRQLDGATAAQLALRDAQANPARGADGERYLADVQRLVQDGPDKPFLGLHFTDERNGFIVGAYNLAFRTVDGGKTWTPWMRQIDNPKGSHLYAVRSAGDTAYIAGEQGLVLRSTNAGQSFERVDIGYKGSFFAIGLQGNGEVVVAGLRGNTYRSNDKGETWTKLDTPIPVSITALAPHGKDSLLLASQSGQLLVMTAGSTALTPLKMRPLPPLNDLLYAPDGSIVVASMFGAQRLPVPAGVAANATANPTESVAAK